MKTDREWHEAQQEYIEFLDKYPPHSSHATKLAAARALHARLARLEDQTPSTPWYTRLARAIRRRE